MIILEENGVSETCAVTKLIRDPEIQELFGPKLEASDFLKLSTQRDYVQLKKQALQVQQQMASAPDGGSPERRTDCPLTEVRAQSTPLAASASLTARLVALWTPNAKGPSAIRNSTPNPTSGTRPKGMKGRCPVLRTSRRACTACTPSSPSTVSKLTPAASF